jgi:predicted dehydrogenase
MIHDLDLLLALVAAPVRSVEAVGLSVLGGHEDVAHAHLVFSSGCVAQVTASRINPTPVRRMQMWAPEGFATIDFARRHLTLLQPSDELRQPRSALRKIAPATLKDELFRRYLPVVELDCNVGDQLTCELQDFVHCVQTGARPRVSGEEGRDALALALRILDSARARAAGPYPIFQPLKGDAAA